MYKIYNMVNENNSNTGKIFRSVIILFIVAGLGYFIYYLCNKNIQTNTIMDEEPTNIRENYNDEEKLYAEIETYDNKTNTGGWGCLFSFNKSIWKPIPDQLKIWYGDNWIHGTNPNIFQLKGMSITTKMSTSSDMMSVRPTRDNDTIEWMKIINNK